MSGIISREIAEGVRIHNLVDSKFKTMRVSFNIIIPIFEETVAENALLPALISRATKEHPSYSDLSKYLSGLYGACLSSSILKIGDNQVMGVSASGISNRYCLNKEDLACELTDLLCSAVFTPLKDSDGLFPEDGFIQEKRQLLENIDADFNDKKLYAKRRCDAIFFEGEPAALSRFGTNETVAALSRENLVNRWNDVLNSAKFEIFVIGDCDFNAVCKKIAPYFNFKREPIYLTNRIVLSCQKPKEVREEMKIAQSKLVMAFRTGVIPEDSTATRVMSVLFGGTPSSKLFANVREKMSLCYYCGSRVSEVKGAMFVESGVETENLDKARDAILEQLELLKDGKFTDEELKCAKLAMIDSYRSIGDSLYAMENWYLNQVFSLECNTPEATIEKISNIGRIEVIEAARKVSLDTVYMLKGTE